MISILGSGGLHGTLSGSGGLNGTLSDEPLLVLMASMRMPLVLVRNASGSLVLVASMRTDYSESDWWLSFSSQFGANSCNPKLNLV